MTQKTSPIPAGYHTVTPYMIVDGAKEAIEFYKAAFGAKETCRMDAPEDKIAHAEIKIGDSHIMLSDAFPERGAHAPDGNSPISLCIYVENVDEVFQRAVDLGSSVNRPVEDQFYGDRSGILTDPFGHTWCLATHIEDVTPEEMERRMGEMESHHTDCC